MALEITGKVFQKLQEEGGIGKTGNSWKKQNFILETLDTQYPKKISIAMWGDKVDTLATIAEGTIVTVFFDVESREYNGKWYTDVKAYRIDVNGVQQGSGASTQQYSNNNTAPRQQTVPQNKVTPATISDDFVQNTTATDDLPF